MRQMPFCMSGVKSTKRTSPVTIESQIYYHPLLCLGIECRMNITIVSALEMSEIAAAIL